MNTLAHTVRRRAILWVPRILALAFILFISIFALDVFDSSYTPSELAFALVVHLLPSLMLITALVIAWLFPATGGIFFLALSAFSLYFFATYRHPVSFIVISLPPLALGLLFIGQGYLMRRRQ
jgi:hypothetical protein